MRISDWSSDVCSSDLVEIGHDCRSTRPDRQIAEPAHQHRRRVLAAYITELEPGRNDGQLLKFTDIGLLQSGGGESGDGYRHRLEAHVAPPRAADDIAQTLPRIGLFVRLRRTHGRAGSGSKPPPRRAPAGIPRPRGTDHR